MRRLIEYDAAQRLSTWHTYNDRTKETTIEYSQNVEPDLDFNKAMQGDPSYKAAGIKRSRMHYAHIPMVVQMQWLVKYGVRVGKKEDEKKVFQLLASPEYKYLRTVNRL